GHSHGPTGGDGFPVILLAANSASLGVKQTARAARRWSRMVVPPHLKAMSMAIQLLAPIRAAAISAFCAFHAAGLAAGSEADHVFLRESTIAWSTAKYSPSADNGFVDGSLDTKTIVDRSFKTYVLENRYLKVTLLPEFGGPILSIIYKP